MGQFKFYLIFALTVLFSHPVVGQKSIHILDAFYEALIRDNSDRISFDLEGGAFQLDDYADQEVSPETIIARHPDAKKYLIQDSILYIKGEFFMTGKIIDLYDFDPSINIKNIHFDYFEPDIEVFNPSSPNEIFYGSDFLLNQVKVNTKFRSSGGGNIQFKIRNSQIKELTLALVYPPSIEIDNSTIDFLQLALLETDRVQIEDCKISQFKIYNIQSSKLYFENNVFNPPLLNDVVAVLDSTTYLRKAFYGNEPFILNSEAKTINRVELINNHFKTTDQEPDFFFKPRGSDVYISGNTFDLCVRLGSRTSSQFRMTDNDFTKLSFAASLPPTPRNFVKIDWEDIKGKLVFKQNKNTPTYYGKNELELADISNFNNLMSYYAKIVETFKNNRNTADANSAYLEMKHFESQRYNYVYKTEGGADNWFRMKLHQLLSIYTEHGTNPAQAITASVWLIFMFSIIYFLFPSDWDLKSKPQLIADFKTLIQKNEHGYFFPFLKLSKGFVISFFNAIVLSINSFVTLGFGKIPTKGFAKYICILEGFLGWFLLSIFIVSLINQVLF